MGEFCTGQTSDSPSPSTEQLKMCLLFFSRPEGFPSQTLSFPDPPPKPLGSEAMGPLIAPFSLVTCKFEMRRARGRREVALGKGGSPY